MLVAGEITFNPPKAEQADLADDAVQTVDGNQTDDEAAQERFRQVQAWRKQAQQAQSRNRREMAIDEDYNDGDQWSAEDKEILQQRGQAPTVFNLIFNTVRWITGTEKRTRVDYRVLPRREDAVKQAEIKTKLLKYLADVNRAGFARSVAFESAVKSGLGWIECGIRSDEDEEPLYYRAESWRNVWFDPHSIEPDLDDCRFLFREKWVDLDLAQAMFPKHKHALEAEAHSLTDPSQQRADGASKYLYGDEDIISTYSDVSDLAEMGVRPRVRLTECWYKVPTRCQVVKGLDDLQGHSLDGAIYDPADPVLSWAVQSELASVHDAIKLQMRLMIYCGDTLLSDGCSPYWHNRFPFIPVWGYRRAADNAPYGAIRQLRDPQDDLNKRRSKALLLLSTNQLIADDDAFDDWDETISEVARPDGVIRHKRGAQVQIRSNASLAPMHVSLMDQDARYIQEVAGVTDENLGRQSNAVSGKAIEARQNQGYTSTSDLFDNLRLAIQLAGEIQLALVEQFYSEEKVFRLTGEKGQADFNQINTGPEDQITASKADFVVDEQDFRGTIRQAMFDQMMEMVLKLPPEIGLKLMVVAFEMSEVPMKEEFIRVIREATGMPDPNAELSDEEKAAVEQEKQAQMMLQQRQIMAQLALLEGKAKEAAAKGDQAEMNKLMTKLLALQQSMKLAGGVAANPQLAQAADQIMRDVTGVNNTAPGLPTNVQ